MTKAVNELGLEWSPPKSHLNKSRLNKSTHQLPRNASSVPGRSILTGTPCASTLRQQVRGVIHKSPGRPCLEATLHAGERPACVGSEQSALTEGNACAGQDKPWNRHVVKEQRLRGMDAPPGHGSENLISLWQSSSRPFSLRRQLSLPNLFHKEHGCPGPRAAQWPIPLRRNLLSQANSPDMASSARVIGPACVSAQREPFGLSKRVRNTIPEARAPSTRCLYALKWSVFSTWCQDRDLDPVTSDVSVVLSFLQEMLDKQRSSSTKFAREP